MHAVTADVIRAEMVAPDPHAAPRADVLSAVVAGHDPVGLRNEIEQQGVDLTRMAPVLTPASDFYARHITAIEARLDPEITTGKFEDLRADMASWQ